MENTFILSRMRGVAVFKRDHNGDLARINSVDIDGMRLLPLQMMANIFT